VLFRSLVTTFLEDLVESETVDEMFAVFENTMAILFDIESVLFFLQSADGRFLHASVSSKHGLHSISRGLKLAIDHSTSTLVTAYQEMKAVYLSEADHSRPLSDKQILALFQTGKVLILPLVVEKKPFGVIAAGLPDIMSEPSSEDLRLMKSVAQQLALSLYLEEQRSRKAEEMYQERMAAVAMTARKFAHEINNPLGIISNYLMAMRMKAPAESEMERDLGIVEEEIQRISTMVGEMHLLSQMSFTHYDQIDINSVIQDIIQLVKTSFFARPELIVSFVPGSDLPLITTSKDAIKQILINLLKNAAEAMTKGGRVVVRTKKAGEQGEEPIRGVEMIVADTGPGLPEKIRKNLFQPFFTTKEGGHSGLGLSIVQKAVSDIGGRISCQTNPEEGTIFTISLQDAYVGRKTL
jgi:signal transduction histidine kinase